MTFDDAMRQLYQVQHDQFVAERKRLAGEVRTAGDRGGAAKLLKLARPSVSVWVTNQLYWHARDDFDALLESAARLRDGDVAASATHRQVSARLRQRAAAMLADAGHGATDATLRKVATNLAAIAAAGGFAPDPAGALSADRAPPGFEAAGVIAEVQVEPVVTQVEEPPAAPEPPAVKHERLGQERLEEERLEQQRLEEQARQAAAERLTAALATARQAVDAAEHRVAAIRRELHDADAKLAAAREHVADLEHAGER